MTEREAFIARLLALPSVRLCEPRRPLISGDVVYVTAEGGHTVAWPPEIRWAGNIVPVPFADGFDMYEFIPSHGLWFGQLVAGGIGPV
jgi:hypothetical protein